MSRAVPLNELHKCIFRAAGSAIKAYSKLTGGWGLEAPESFFQYQIAIALRKYCFVSVEDSVLGVRGTKKMVGRMPSDKQERYDLVAWWGVKPGARLAIEIKKAVSRDSCNGDIKKLKRAINKKWIEGGVIVACAIGQNRSTVKNRLRGIRENIIKACKTNVELDWERIRVVEYKGKPKRPMYWGVGCYELAIGR